MNESDRLDEIITTCDSAKGGKRARSIYEQNAVKRRKIDEDLSTVTLLEQHLLVQLRILYEDDWNIIAAIMKKEEDVVKHMAEIMDRDKRTCMWCKKTFHKKGIGPHRTHCSARQWNNQSNVSKESSEDSSELRWTIEGECRRCSRCNRLFDKKGIGPHYAACEESDAKTVSTVLNDVSSQKWTPVGTLRRCGVCSKFFNKKGIGPHYAACSQKGRSTS